MTNGVPPSVEEADCPNEEEQSPDDEWISVKEAARRAGIPWRTLYHWVEAGTWPVRVVKYSPRRYQVRLSEFEAWLAARRAERE